VAVGFTAGLAGFLFLIDDGRFGPPARSAAAAYGPFASFDRGWCLVWLGVTLAWLALPTAGARFALACGILVTAPIAALATPGLPGAARLADAPPLHLVFTFVGLALTGIVAGPGRLRDRWLPFALTAATTLGLSVVVGAYDNAWRFSGWQDPRATTVLVSTLGLAPFALVALTGADTYAHRRSRRELAASLAALAVASGWLAYVAVPYLLSWGPVLLLLAGCGVVALLPQLLRRRTGKADRGAAALTFVRERHGDLTTLADLLIDRPDAAARFAGRALVHTFAELRYLPDEAAVTRRARQRLLRITTRQPVMPHPERTETDPVWLAVRRLPGPDRAAWVLRSVYGLPVTEIAVLLRLRPRVAERVLARAEAAARVAPLASLLFRQS
jgi:hypothetical protein